MNPSLLVPSSRATKKIPSSPILVVPHGPRKSPEEKNEMPISARRQYPTRAKFLRPILRVHRNKRTLATVFSKSVGLAPASFTILTRDMFDFFIQRRLSAENVRRCWRQKIEKKKIERGQKGGSEGRQEEREATSKQRQPSRKYNDVLVPYYCIT
jgi:hypothetical protein